MLARFQDVGEVIHRTIATHTIYQRITTFFHRAVSGKFGDGREGSVFTAAAESSMFEGEERKPVFWVGRGKSLMISRWVALR